MKRIFILWLALVLLLAITSSGTVSSFKDSETSTDNQLIFQWTPQCPHGKFNIADNNNDKIFMYDDYGAFIATLDLDAENSFPSGAASETDFVYVLDQEDKQVYRYSYCGGPPAVSGVLRKTGGSGLGNPSGLAIPAKATTRFPLRKSLLWTAPSAGKTIFSGT